MDFVASIYNLWTLLLVASSIFHLVVVFFRNGLLSLGGRSVAGQLSSSMTHSQNQSLLNNSVSKAIRPGGLPPSLSRYGNFMFCQSFRILKRCTTVEFKLRNHWFE